MAETVARLSEHFKAKFECLASLCIYSIRHPAKDPNKVSLLDRQINAASPGGCFPVQLWSNNTCETSLLVPKGFLSQAPHDQKM